MNVFVLSRDNEQRARHHCDTHVNKMLLESVQILNTALHKNNCRHTFYQKTHTNHPWCEWAARRYANWEWLLGHAQALHDEFQRRFDKTHKSGVKMEEKWLEDSDHLSVESKHGNIRMRFREDGERTMFPLCMPDEYAEYDDPVTAYRQYYVGEKVPEDWCSWSTEVPDWVFEMQ